MKIWILIGRREGEKADELIEAWTHKPTKKEQQEAFRQYVRSIFDDGDGKDDIAAQEEIMSTYTVPQGGDHYVTSIVPKTRDFSAEAEGALAMAQACIQRVANGTPRASGKVYLSKILKGDYDLTVREFAEILSDRGFELSFSVKKRKKK